MAIDKILVSTDTIPNTQLAEIISDTLKALTPDERNVVRMRYGLDNGRVRTVAEVGRELSITRKRIRKIEGKVLRKLRRPTYSKQQKELIEVEEL